MVVTTAILGRSFVRGVRSSMVSISYSPQGFRLQNIQRMAPPYGPIASSAGWLGADCKGRRGPRSRAWELLTFWYANILKIVMCIPVPCQVHLGRRSLTERARPQRSVFVLGRQDHFFGRAEAEVARWHGAESRGCTGGIGEKRAGLDRQIPQWPHGQKVRNPYSTTWREKCVERGESAPKRHSSSWRFDG